MKKLFLIYIFSFLAIVASSQITTSLVVNPSPSAVLSDWYNDRTIINYVVNSQGLAGQPDVPVIIKTELTLTDGTIVATTDLSKATVYVLPRGTRVFFASEVFSLHIMIFSGYYKSTLERTGKLPTGTYQITVQLVRPVTFDAITQPITRVFNFAAIQLPILMKPFNGEKLKEESAQTTIIFRWTPAVLSQREQPFYRLQVFEILNSQNPLQALRGNQPLLDVTVRSQTQYIWRPQLSFIDDSTDKKFIWTIQSLDVNREPLIRTDGNGESRSEPFIFYIETETYKDNRKGKYR